MHPGTALLVIDMQNDAVRADGIVTVAGAEAAIPRLASLMASFRKEKLPLWHACRVYRPDGSDVEKVRRKAFFENGGFLVEGTAGAQIVAGLAPVEDEPVFTRPAWSAFDKTGLSSALTTRSVRRLILGGIDLPNSVRVTAYDALGLGLDVIVVRDGTASQRDDVHEANLADLARVGVKIDTCLEVIREASAGLLARP